MDGKRSILFFLGILAYFSAQAQYSISRCKWVKSEGVAFPLDSMTVVPESIRVSGEMDFEYDLNTGKILIPATSDSVEICYTYFPFSLHQKMFNRSFQDYDSGARFETVPEPVASLGLEKEELFPTAGIAKTGSISRGVTFGNNQNVFVNSSLNLQMEGKLSDDLNIRAAISDQNIPFQPEGNTQQLQDFDRVFIELYNDRTQLIVGDIVLKNQESQFLKYYKNVQGGHFRTRYQAGKSEAETSLSLSFGKGKFASIQVDPLEGVAGPYRLRGPNEERFIIILANSEKVFLDGRQLKRGFNHDYTIDYNLGEITFNSNILITKFSRIRVDYEYSEQNYSRTILQAGHSQKWDRFRFFVDAYSEKDNKNNPLTFDLTAENQQIFSEIGDSLSTAFVGAVDSVQFNENEILYKMIDTVDQSGAVVEDILVRSVNPDSAFFRASFSRVKQGNYVLLSSTANGRVFQWVSPVNGVPQGEYAPVRVIPLPLKRNMVVGGIEYDLTEKDRIFGEVAFSDQDGNLYSDKGNEDNQGYAIKLGYETRDRKVGKYTFQARTDYEFDNKNFLPVDRFRYIEFDRDWSYNSASDESQATENILNLNAGLRKDPDNGLNYTLTYRKRGEVVNGTQHKIELDKSLGRLQLNSDVFIMDNDNSRLNSEWTRINADLFLRSKIFVPGYLFSLDNNQVRMRDTDSLSTAMNFTAHQFYIRSNDSLKVRFRLDHTYREDNSPIQNEIRLNNISNTTNFFFTMMSNPNHQVNFNTTYRTIENLNQSENRIEETIQGRLDWTSNFFKRSIRSELSYAVTSGRELKKEFVYLEVPLGEGTHTWRDDNGDGVQDLNEFYEALNPDESNFAKIFLPTDEFIDAFATLFNYRINIGTPSSWRFAKGFKKMLSRFSNITSWSIDRKITDDNLKARLIPFSQVDEEDLLANKEVLRSTLFFNRTNPKFGGEVGIVDTDRKLLLTEGFESVNRREYRFNLRWNIKKAYNFRLLSSRNRESVSSDFLTARNYQILGNSIGQEFAWQPKNTFRVAVQYTYKDKSNVFSETSTEGAVFNDFQVNMRVSKVSKSTFIANFIFSDIEFEGDQNTALGYALLEALQPGKNYRWSLNWQQKITKGLQMNLVYSGRKSGESQVVNVGRVQVSALF